MCSVGSFNFSSDFSFSSDFNFSFNFNFQFQFPLELWINEAFRFASHKLSRSWLWKKQAKYLITASCVCVCVCVVHLKAVACLLTVCTNTNTWHTHTHTPLSLVAAFWVFHLFNVNKLKNINWLYCFLKQHKERHVKRESAGDKGERESKSEGDRQTKVRRELE